MRNLIGIAVILAAVGAAPSFAQTAPAKTADSAKGKILVDMKGMTLYSFDKDTPGKSTCNGTCIQNWPALAAAKNSHGSGDWSVVTRDDGSMQWAYKTKPLYTFAKDTKAGEMTGD
jgi:predicted lipoprotein with Yx(FWY)xxD motif